MRDREEKIIGCHVLCYNLNHLSRFLKKYKKSLKLRPWNRSENFKTGFIGSWWVRAANVVLYLLWHLSDEDTECSELFQDLHQRSQSRIWRVQTWTPTAWSSDTSWPKTLRPVNSSSVRADVWRRFLLKVQFRASLRTTSTKVWACCFVALFSSFAVVWPCFLKWTSALQSKSDYVWSIVWKVQRYDDLESCVVSLSLSYHWLLVPVLQACCSTAMRKERREAACLSSSTWLIRRATNWSTSPSSSVCSVGFPPFSVTCCAKLKAKMFLHLVERRKQLLQIYPFVLPACWCATEPRTRPEYEFCRTTFCSGLCFYIFPVRHRHVMIIISNLQ